MCALCGGIMAQTQATPRNGEGVDAFLRRNGLKTKADREAFMEQNKEKLTKDGGLILGRTYTLPVPGSRTETPRPSDTVKEPLFGPEYETVKVTSHELEGACLYLVSGHGGPDPGCIATVGKTELHEDEYAYDIILRLGRTLMEHGATVHFIIQDAKDGIRNDRYLCNSDRETCMGSPIPLNQVERLQQRCDCINRLHAAGKEKYRRAIFIHVDSRQTNERVDVFFYHACGSQLGKRLTDNLHSTFCAQYNRHQPNRGFGGTTNERELYVLHHANPVAAFLELGNLQNENDRKRLVLPSNRQALADWICKGIIKDFNEK